MGKLLRFAGVVVRDAAVGVGKVTLVLAGVVATLALCFAAFQALGAPVQWATDWTLGDAEPWEDRMFFGFLVLICGLALLLVYLCIRDSVRYIRRTWHRATSGDAP